MNDMSGVIVPKSDQVNADDFLAGAKTYTIRDVKIQGGQEQPVSISLEGTDKFYRPCKSMSRVLVAAWGADAKLYVGRSLTLYTDPTVKWGGMNVGGIRISHMTDITGKLQLSLTATKGQRKPHTVMPLVMTAQTASKPAVSAADREAQMRADIDALTDAAAVAVWLADNAAYKDHKSDRARAIYQYAEERGKSLAVKTADDSGDWPLTEEELDDAEAKIKAAEMFPAEQTDADDFPGDRK